MQVNFVQENIPVSLNFIMKLKEKVHHFFRRPLVVEFISYLPALLIGKSKKLAELIMKCHRTFANSPTLVNQMAVQIYGGDKLTTLVKLEDELKSKAFKQFSTVFKFSSENCLDAARSMQKEIEDAKERVGILNLANRRQPGGVGLAPYGGSQEEYLVRRSCLAWSLDPQFETAKVHEKMHEVRLREGYADEHFEHHIPYFGTVLTKNVTFIDQDHPDQFDIISSAAIDLRKGSDESIHLKKLSENEAIARKQILESKIRAIFATALAENIENLILGAFGCGCFLNSPEEVAETFANVLNSDLYKNKFKRITFRSYALNTYLGHLKYALTASLTMPILASNQVKPV